MIPFLYKRSVNFSWDLFFPAVGIFLIFFYTTAEAAEGSQAREVARLNNCTPKKVDIYQQAVGSNAPTIYRVSCITPKTTNEKAPQMANSVLVQCTGTLCEFLRPLLDASN